MVAKQRFINLLKISKVEKITFDFRFAKSLRFSKSLKTNRNQFFTFYLFDIVPFFRSEGTFLLNQERLTFFSNLMM